MNTPQDPRDLIPRPQDLELPRPGGGPTPPKLVPVPRDIKMPPPPQKPKGDPK